MRGNRKRWRASIVSTFIAGFCLAIHGQVKGQYLTIYGGPTYDSSTNTGFKGLVSSPSSGVFGIGAVSQGLGSDPLPVRWDASGTLLLDNLNAGNSGSINGEANAANSSGTIAGAVNKYVAGVDKGDRSARWDSSGTVTELGSLGTDSAGVGQSFAFSINESGTIVGTADKYIAGVQVGTRAVRWDPASVAAIELADPGTSSSSDYNSEAVAINDTGIVAGYADKIVSGNYEGIRVVRWNAAGTIGTALGDLGTDANGITEALPHDINKSGDIVGYAEKYVATNDLGKRAVRWDGSNSAAVELDNLGTDSNGKTSSQALAINDFGTTVGSAGYIVGGVSKGIRAVRWDAGGTVATKLGDLGTDSNGTTLSQAADINNAGIAVGFALELGNHANLRATMWGADGVAIDLNTLIDPSSGWKLTNAETINNDGWISGIGTYDPDGPGGLAAYNRLFLLQVPEPASMTLLAVCTVSILSRRRIIPWNNREAAKSAK